MPVVNSMGGKMAFGRPYRRLVPSYRYYRWQVTLTKSTPDTGVCQASEFVFQLNGTDQQSTTSTATVTNPSGSNPVGEEPPKLVDNNLTTKCVDTRVVILNHGRWLGAVMVLHGLHSTQ